MNTSHAFILNSNQVKPQVIPNPGDGTVIGTRYYSFDNDTAKFVSSVLKTGLTAIATLAGYTFGPGAATTIASICTLAGEYINLKPYWTTVKIIRYYSDYYDQYIYDAYHFVYSDSKRTNLKKVFISDDMIKTRRYDQNDGQCIGYILIEGESIVHESKKKICLSSRRADGHILFRLHV
ncbi:hypothetical protein [Geobacillus stearothermophilus]|uniref:hypothetical protein n=1 Tax=Geobacillus stearothermophilus TaxID=1422 RepID=UPI003D1BEDDD